MARCAPTSPFHYAAPPLGDLRWRAPKAAASWIEPLNNTNPAASCLQTGDSPFRVPGDSEDCALYLDVHAPEGEGPVPGDGLDPWRRLHHWRGFLYADPSPLVSKGVIVVGINYRLEVDGLPRPPHAARCGWQRRHRDHGPGGAALVQANIAQFGGDKDNVTIFGESAGGLRDDDLAFAAVGGPVR